MKEDETLEKCKNLATKGLENVGLENMCDTCSRNHAKRAQRKSEICAIGFNEDHQLF